MKNQTKKVDEILFRKEATLSRKEAIGKNPKPGLFKWEVGLKIESLGCLGGFPGVKVGLWWFGRKNRGNRVLTPY